MNAMAPAPVTPAAMVTTGSNVGNVPVDDAPASIPPFVVPQITILKREVGSGETGQTGSSVDMPSTQVSEPQVMKPLDTVEGMQSGLADINLASSENLLNNNVLAESEDTEPEVEIQQHPFLGVSPGDGPGPPWTSTEAEPLPVDTVEESEPARSASPLGVRSDTTEGLSPRGDVLKKVEEEAVSGEAEAEALPSEAEALPSETEALPTEAEALPSEAEALPSEAETVPTEADPTQEVISESTDPGTGDVLAVAVDASGECKPATSSPEGNSPSQDEVLETSQPTCATVGGDDPEGSSPDHTVLDKDDPSIQDTDQTETHSREICDTDPAVVTEELKPGTETELDVDLSGWSGETGNEEQMTAASTEREACSTIDIDTPVTTIENDSGEGQNRDVEDLASAGQNEITGDTGTVGIEAPAEVQTSPDLPLSVDIKGYVPPSPKPSPLDPTASVYIPQTSPVNPSIETISADSQMTFSGDTDNPSSEVLASEYAPPDLAGDYVHPAAVAEYLPTSTTMMCEPQPEPSQYVPQDLPGESPAELPMVSKISSQQPEESGSERENGNDHSPPQITALVAKAVPQDRKQRSGGFGTPVETSPRSSPLPGSSPRGSPRCGSAGSPMGRSILGAGATRDLGAQQKSLAAQRHLQMAMPGGHWSQGQPPPGTSTRDDALAVSDAVGRPTPEGQSISPSTVPAGQPGTQVLEAGFQQDQRLTGDRGELS